MDGQQELRRRGRALKWERVDSDIDTETLSIEVQAFADALDVMPGCNQSANERDEEMRKVERAVADLEDPGHGRSDPLGRHEEISPEVLRVDLHSVEAVEQSAHVRLVIEEKVASATVPDAALHRE